jgi:glycosyltransferase involved in cell wall biosynthesis
MPVATVVVCTHDRADVLGDAVAAAAAQAGANDAEVLVVDNASTDGTPAVLAEMVLRHAPLVRVAREPRLGLSAARNRGLADARGDVVVYLDDDAVPRPGWLAALLRPYAEPAVACTGGRIALAFPTPPPAWLPPEIHGAFSAFDLGDAPRRLRYGRDDYPYGANVSFRAATARALGGFSTRLGPLGRVELVHDETDLCYRLDRAGHEVRYVPDAIVDHRVGVERMAPERILRRFRMTGRSGAVFVLRNRGLLRALWRIRWLYARHLVVPRYVPADPIDATRFVRECRRQEALGYVGGLVRALPELRDLRRGIDVPLALEART